jgi:tetratricopeptide (TPR) repeat protein
MIRMQIITSEDTKKLIQEKLAKDNARSLLEVLSQQLLSCPNHYSNKVELQQAIEYLSSVLGSPKDIDNNIPKMLQLSSLLFQNNVLEAAYSWSSKVLELDPNSRDAYIIRAGCFYSWSNYLEALSEINQAIELSDAANTYSKGIEEHFQKDPNNENILLVEVPDSLKELLGYRDKILSKIHNSMCSYYG